MKIGIDLVKIIDLKNKLSGDLTKIFTTSELEFDSKKLAGVFTAKEAFFKAIGRKEDWLSVWLENEKSGKPVLKSILPLEEKNIEVSISYTEEYAMAVVLIY